MEEWTKFHTFEVSSPLHNDTYLVQVPRDQIHRIPPPENARIVEEHTRIATDPTKNDFRKKVFVIAGSVLLFIILLSILLSILRATVYNPGPPEFSVKGLKVANLKAYWDKGRPVPIYTITLRVKNPNSNMNARYRPGQGVFLTFKDEVLGKGKFPSVKGNGDFPVAVTGKPPETVEMYMEGSGIKTMELNTVVPVELSSWLRKEKMDVRLYCTFSVRNSLVGKAAIKVVSQECITDP